MTNQNAVVVYKKSLAPIAEQAQTLEIVDAGTLKTGVKILSQLNNFNDKIVEEKERITKPLNAALKVERSRWSPLEKMYTGAIENLRTKMSQYQTSLVKLQREAEAKIAAKVSSGYIKIETGVKKLSNVAIVEKEIASDVGLVQFRETKVLKITDSSIIPANYYIIDETKLFTDLKAGITIPGAEIEIIQTPINYR